MAKRWTGRLRGFHVVNDPRMPAQDDERREEKRCELILRLIVLRDAINDGS